MYNNRNYAKITDNTIAIVISYEMQFCYSAVFVGIVAVSHGHPFEVETPPRGFQRKR